MAEGKSYASFAGAIGVGQSTLSGWEKSHPEFKNAKEIAILASLGKWEDIALRQAQGFIKGNASALIFTLKNRFQEHYKDKQEIDHGGELTFIFNTGINRNLKEVEQAHEAEFKVLESEPDADLL